MSPWLIGLDIVFLLAVLFYFHYLHLKRKYIYSLMKFQTRLAELIAMADSLGSRFGTSEQRALLFEVNILARRVRTLGDYRHLLELFSASITLLISTTDKKETLRRGYLHRLALTISALEHLELFSARLTRHWLGLFRPLIRIPAEKHSRDSYRRFVCRLIK